MKAQRTLAEFDTGGQYFKFAVLCFEVPAVATYVIRERPHQVVLVDLLHSQSRSLVLCRVGLDVDPLMR